MEKSDHRYYMFTDPDGVELFCAEMDDYHAGITTRMTVPLDEVRKAIEDFDREKGGGEVFARRIRIEGKPGDVTPSTLTLHDADTDEEIKNVFKATIYLDARKTSRAELDYYESDEDGAIRITNPYQLPIRKSISIDPEIDITAYEKRRRS